MGANTTNAGWPRDGVLRAVIWGGAGLLFLLPVVAYQVASLPWTGSDFVAWAVMLCAAGGVVELGLRLSRNHCYRAAMAVAAGAAFFLVWIHLAVGIIDVEDDRAMLMFFAPLAIGAVGAVIAGFRASGLALTLFTMTIAQLLIAVLARLASPSQPEGWIVSLVFALAWFTSAQLFRVAARQQALAGA